MSPLNGSVVVLPPGVAFKRLRISEFPSDNASSNIHELTNITSLPRPTAA